jgi:hypothetical protein
MTEEGLHPAPAGPQSSQGGARVFFSVVSVRSVVNLFFAAGGEFFACSEET